MNALLFLWIFLSTPTFAIDRSAYVKSAASEIKSQLEFVSNQPAFVSMLSTAEKEQFIRILATSKKLPEPILVKFSDRSSDFILNPGEPERSAKTTADINDPIWFNTHKLYEDVAAINYLTVLQLFVHEIGHKIGPQKNQAAIDSLAVKFHDFLESYHKMSPMYLDVTFGPPRPLSEELEILALPKSLSALNPNPPLFYKDKKKIWPLALYFEDSLKQFSRDRYVQVNFVRGEADMSLSYVVVNFSILKEFTHPRDGTLFGVEGTYTFKENLFFEFDGGPRSINFRLANPEFSYPKASLDSEVLGFIEKSRSESSIHYSLALSLPEPPQKVSLLSGTEENHFLVPCRSIVVKGGTYEVDCELTLPKKTAISILDIFQVIVDGRVVDFPEVYELDIEAMQIPFALADVAPKRIEKKSEEGATSYELRMESSLPPIQVRVRCPQKKQFIYDGMVLGELESFSEIIFFPPNLPVHILNEKEYLVKARCEEPDVLPEEILITDGTLYTSRPRWK